jgi:integrase
MGRIADFLLQYNNRDTQLTYSAGVVYFLSHIYGIQREKGQHHSKEEHVRFNVLAERYFSDSRDYVRDMIEFSNHCEGTIAPTTARLYLSIVREFMAFNDVDFTRKQEKNIRNKAVAGGPISEEADLTKGMIRSVLNAADIRLKAIILIILSSGLRIGELVKLRWENVTLAPDLSYGTISLRGVSLTRRQRLKNRYSRVTFISKEAAEALAQWQEVRAQYVKTSCDRSHWMQPADVDDDRVFPYSESTLCRSLLSTLKRANLYSPDEDTHRSAIHFHLFRKYFITTLTYSGISEKYVDFFAGHLDELDRAYQKQSKEQLLEIYLKGEPFLRVYDEGAEEIARQQNEIHETKDKLRDMQIERLTDRARLEDIQKDTDQRIREMQNTMEQLKRAMMEK